MKRALLFLPIIMIAACAPDISDPAIQAAVINSLTATVWTPIPPTPTFTPEPNTARIVDVFNNVMTGMDPLAETMDSKFTVVDAQIIVEQSTGQATTLRVLVDCEWVFSDSCTPESTFVALMHGLSANDKVTIQVGRQLPLTVKVLEVLALNRMKKTNMICVPWQDVLDFVSGRINGNQLGSRIVRMAGT